MNALLREMERTPGSEPVQSRAADVYRVETPADNEKALFSRPVTKAAGGVVQNLAFPGGKPA